MNPVRAALLPRLLACAFALLAVTLPPGTSAARRGGGRRVAARVRAPATTVPSLEVQTMGARAAAATDAMRARMREHVARQLRVLVKGRVLNSPHGYLVDGSIDALEIVTSGDALEISCSVRLILSARQSGTMLAMTTGQATFKSARRPRPPAGAHLELEVLDNAVRAAGDELISHFALRNAT
jgi:hypothetical protein